MTHQFIKLEMRGRVALITLDRPEARNALNQQLLKELGETLRSCDANPLVGAMVLTGTARYFAAGADIKEMLGKDGAGVAASGFLRDFGAPSEVSKPVVAAVSGWVLGGGCELALACDMIIASETARFGQPELTIGVIPGGGATQRLGRAVGKVLAMEMILTGRQLTASEALQAGLVNRVVPEADFLSVALELAAQLASRAPLAVAAAKKAVLAADELPLSEGLEAERAAFISLFDSVDRKEGMQAFVEKRQPAWRGK